MSFVPLHLHSTYSLLDGLSQTNQIADKCREYGYGACALTDHGTLAGIVEFVQSCKENKKKNKPAVKPILGIELYLSTLPPTIKDKNNRRLSHLPLLCKNKAGWSDLIKLVSKSNTQDFFYYKPRVDLATLAEFCKKNWIAFSGHPGSDLYNALFKERNSDNGYVADPLSNAEKVLNRYVDIFGKENFFIEIQTVCANEENKKSAEILRELSKRTGVPTMASLDSHYINRADAEDQRVILCSSLKTTLKKVKQAISDEEFGLSEFFINDRFHLPSLEEMKQANTEEEIANTQLIADMCEDYNILGKPNLPKFECPNGLSEAEYLKELCRVGWKEKLVNYGVLKTSELQNTYLDRIKHELAVIEKANLSGYFLIMQDYVNWAKKQDWLIGPGRGSADGCLISYLVGITTVDPIPHDLLFTRFYNEGRNTKDHIAFPDIDIDVPKFKREDIIEYLKEKYGREKVCQIATFGRLQGRGAIKEVLRVHDACSFEEMNQITKNIPDEAAIADEMEEQKIGSIIEFVLENEPALVADYAQYDENKKLIGPYAKYFEQAIRIEGTLRTQGKHAAGIIIAPDDISQTCPIIQGKDGGSVAAFDMYAMESLGYIKLDVLGISALDKLMFVNELLK
jgi:DNA polymerase-3 subunit alpha